MKIKAFKIALDPTPEVEQQFYSHAGARLFCWNMVLGYMKNCYKEGVETGFPSHKYLRDEVWMKHRDEWAVSPETGEVWWSQNSKHVYDMACLNLAQAYLNFFDKELPAGPPKRKKKNKVNPSFQFAEGVKLVGFHHLHLPKIGLVKTHESLRNIIPLVVSFKQIKTVTISRNARGRWSASLVVHCEDQKYEAPFGPVVGIDLGLKTLAVVADSNGKVLMEEPNSRHLKANLARLRRAQKALARSQHNSARYNKKKKRVARIHDRVANLRKDQINKFTTKVAERFPIVGVEDLAVKNLTKNKKLARSIQDAGWGEIRRQLCYKVDTVVIVDRFFASSKTCSECKAVKAKLLLSERQYVCTECGSIFDRDANAARNLALVASNLSSNEVGYTLSGRGHSVRPSKRRARMGTRKAKEASSLSETTLDSNARISNQPTNVDVHKCL